jgi:COMPASS component SWD2
VQDEQCNGISFSDSGVMCCSSHNDGALRVMRGDGRPEERSEYFIKDIGCRLVTYTHHEACVLHTASLGEGDARGYISYHSLHDNKILRYFRGHTDYVTALCMSPDSDKFLTASKDGSFRLWDLRSPTAEVGAELWKPIVHLLAC